MPSQDEVLAVVRGERVHQETLVAEQPRRPVLPVEGELLLVLEYGQRALATYTETFGDPGEIPTLDVLRKIAAICIRAMEHHGAPARVLNRPGLRQQLGQLRTNDAGSSPKPK